MDQAIEGMEEKKMKLSERAEEILEVSQVVLPLRDMGTKDRGTIAYLSTNDERRLQKLMAMGALPGLRIAVIQKFPSYVFQLGQSQFAVDKELAEGIYVRLEKG
ncbi:MAG: ferrous iron transport protein A [Desulfobacteraceae bacterium]|nr:MAG: ferrous iron transport protein A [Desulfobacteraceae bacterium]